MRKLQMVSTFAVMVGLSCGPSLVSAATWGAGVYGAFNTHSMQDWNDAIDQSNASGSEYDNINSGLTGGLDVRSWLTPTWLVTAGWEPMFLKSEDKSTPGQSVSLDGSAFTATAAYFFPSGGNGKYGLGAGLGYYTNSGKVESPGSSIDVQGSGIGFHFMGLAEWKVSPSFNVTGAAGYRVANVSKTELSDGTTTADSPYDNDYSGATARLGLAFYLPTAN